MKHFEEFWWDTACPRERRSLQVAWLRRLVKFVRDHVPFYRFHYRDLSTTAIDSIQTISDFLSTVPFLTKHHLSTSSPLDFLPEDSITNLAHLEPRIFGTGGTTNQPVSVIHSAADWRAMAVSANRHIAWDLDRSDGGIGRRDLDGAIIFGAYHGDHITNHIYRTMLSDFGAVLAGRRSIRSEIGENLKLIEELGASGLLAPPENKESRQAKGLSLESVLTGLIRERRNSNFRFPCFNLPFLFWSSASISSRHIELARELFGTRFVKGHFGSTEVCPTASSCPANPGIFHPCYGPSIIHTWDPRTGLETAAGKPGYLTVSKIASLGPDGVPGFPTGSIFLHFLAGDQGVLSRDGQSCACGRNTPRLEGVSRIRFQAGKSRFGCQIG